MVVSLSYRSTTVVTGQKIESGQGSLKALVQNYPPKEMLRLADDLLDQGERICESQSDYFQLQLIDSRQRSEESVEDIKQASRCAMEKHQKEQAASTKRKDVRPALLFC